MTSVLFVGGTGQISASCVPLAVERGFDVAMLNRGESTSRSVPDGVESIRADIRNPESVRAALGDREFDVVAQFLTFTPEHAATDLELFSGRTGQFHFISSASAYQTPPQTLPITESTPLDNPFWKYSRDKATVEDMFLQAHADAGFPVTIVRPSHTYDATGIPTAGGWTDAERMLRGANVVVVGDGTTPWTVTHSRDFAVGFVGLFANPATIGEAFHITSDFAPTWNELYGILGRALGVDPLLVHASAEDMAAVDESFGAGILGDKSHPMVLDNSKIRSFVPDFAPTITPEQGLAESVAWHLADPARRGGDPRVDDIFDRILARLPGL